MELFGIVILILMVIPFFITSRKRIKREEDQQILAKQEQLRLLDQQIQDRTIDRNISLTNIEIRVLDIYDQSSIRIPIDIIEDLSHMNLDNEKDIFDYIENQRYFWKLENTKKPYKKVVK